MITNIDFELNGNVFNDISALLGLSHQEVTIESQLDVFDIAQAGLPISCLHSFSDKSGFTDEEISHGLQISKRTLRRWARQLPVLPTQQSCQLWLIVNIFIRAVETIGSPITALTWLRQPQVSLRRQVPMELLENCIGCFLLLELLDQIDNGVYI